MTKKKKQKIKEELNREMELFRKHNYDSEKILRLYIKKKLSLLRKLIEQNIKKGR